MTQKRRQNSKIASKWYRLVALGAIGVGFFGLLVYVFVFKNEIRDTEVVVPLISAPETPVKRRPDNPGGLDIPNRDKTVYDLLAPEVKTAQADDASMSLGKETSAPEAKAVEVAQNDQIEEKIEEAAKPAPKPEPKVEEKPAPAPVEKPQPAPKPAPKPVEKKASEPVKTTGDWGVQLASFVNQTDADRAIKTYLQKYGELSALSPRVQRVVLGNGKGTRYRAQFFGLQEKSDSIALCKKLSAKKQGCLQVKK